MLQQERDTPYMLYYFEQFFPGENSGEETFINATCKIQLEGLRCP